MQQINKYAFSEGEAVIEKHRKNGNNCELVSFQCLRFFMTDDNRVEQIQP